MGFKTLLSLIVCLMVVAILGQTDAEKLSGVYLEGCLKRTGLQPREIITINLRNGQCSVDCATKQTTVLTYFKQDGESCEVPEHRCLFGKCLPKSLNFNATNMQNLDLEIVSASVPDLDQSANGDSDAFVVVSVVQDKRPLYNKDDVLCHTFIVQDSDKPEWRFKCLDIPIPGNSLIKFAVYDADPARAEFIGSVIYSTDYLKNYNGAFMNIPLFKFNSAQEETGVLRIRAFMSSRVLEDEIN